MPEVIKVTDTAIIQEIGYIEGVTMQKIILTKEAFIEAYNKWIKTESSNDPNGM